MILRELNRTSCKSYLIADNDARKAIIVDPLRENVDRYLALLGYLQLNLDLLIDTHTHADHRSACWELRYLTDAKVAMQRWAPSPAVNIHLDDGDEVAVGNLTALVLHTPGHTPDGMSIVINGHVFTGDTLFIGGSGRTDFPGGDAGAQFDSISKLFELADDTIVHPGHDYRGNDHSTIGEEKQSNPRVAGRSREEYVDLMNNLGLAPPQNIQEVLQPNQSAIEGQEIDFPAWTDLKRVQEVTGDDLNQQIMASQEDVLVVDVREAEEYSGELGHIAGSCLLPLRELVQGIVDVCDDKDRPIITVCRAGMRSATAAAILVQLGFRHVMSLRGGMLAWTDAELPVIDRRDR